MREVASSITSLDDLKCLEQRIAAEIARHPLDRLLLGLRAMSPYVVEPNRGVPPHVIGTAARFATRYGVPGPMTASANPLSPRDLNSLLRLCADFAHADPIGWNSTVPNSVLAIMLRHAGNQFPYADRPHGRWGRAEIMYNELPDIVRLKPNGFDFDFHARFTELTGVSITDFIDVGYILYSAARGANHLGFAGDYFENARADGMTIPDDSSVRQVLSHFAADSSKHAQLYSKYCQKDDLQDFAAYDFNSLFVYPLIRPWPLEDNQRMELDRMVAPLPELVLYRLTSGVYYHMRDQWPRSGFDEFFGHLLEAYVGQVLGGFVAASKLISEEQIRKTFPTSAGKVPDWILLDGSTAIIIEVKVARVHRIVYATGAEDKLEENLDAIRGGLKQLFGFSRAASQKTPGLERLSHCKELINVLITLEPNYLCSSEPYKNRMRESLEPEMRSMEWAMLSLDELERFQTHLSGDEIDIASTFRLAMHQTPAKAIESMAKQSGRTFSHSMLCRKEDELQRRIGLPSSSQRFRYQ